MHLKLKVQTEVCSLTLFSWVKSLALGAWVAQLVKDPTLDFGSGHGLTVHEINPQVILCTDSIVPA